jgi:hypothetical protein
MEYSMFFFSDFLIDLCIPVGRVKVGCNLRILQVSEWGLAIYKPSLEGWWKMSLKFRKIYVQSESLYFLWVSFLEEENL